MVEKGTLNLNNIFYVGYYARETTAVNRSRNIAASRKMDYIARELLELNKDLCIVSPSYAEDPHFTQGIHYIKREEQNDDGIRTIYTPSLLINIRRAVKIKALFSLLWLCWFLICNTSAESVVVVYHMPLLSLPLRISKRIRKFKFILEVEEVYSDIWEKYKKYKKSEFSLIQAADGYIFASELLQKQLDPKKQKSTTIYGEYSYQASYTKNRATNGVQLVYAGSVDTIKNGAFIAVEAMEYLPEEYSLILLGHGSNDDIAQLKKIVFDMNRLLGREGCKYLGVLHGQALSDTLLSCNIGLNPQNMGDYMATAFPSKIMVYLNHGLKVVSTPVASLCSSKVAQAITFTSSSAPEDIAKAIARAKENHCDVPALISELKRNCQRDLRQLLT